MFPKSVRTKILSISLLGFLSFQVGEEFIIPVSHEREDFMYRSGIETLLKMWTNCNSIWWTLKEKASNEFRHTPNGSTCAIEGIVSPERKNFRKMGHSERKGEDLYKNIPGNKVQDIFSNGVNYFK